MERNPDPTDFFRREDPLLKIRDRTIRDGAERARALILEKQENEVARLRVKFSGVRQKWEQNLNRMSPKNPIRMLGEFVYARIQTSQHLALARVLKNSTREVKKIIDQAIAADRPIQSQREPSQRAQPIHQEKSKNILEQRAEQKDRQRGIDSGHEEQRAREGHRRNIDRGRGR